LQPQEAANKGGLVLQVDFELYQREGKERFKTREGSYDQQSGQRLVHDGPPFMEVKQP